MTNMNIKKRLAALLGAALLLTAAAPASFADDTATPDEAQTPGAALVELITPKPKAEETPTPTPEPTATPTATPTAEPTATPTAEPTATPTVPPAQNTLLLAAGDGSGDGGEDAAKTVAAPGATWKFDGGSVSITVTGEADLQMVVFTDLGEDYEVYAGETVTFSGAEAGKSYEIEVDYYEVQSGVSPFRGSMNAPAAEPEDTQTTPPADTQTTPPASAETTPPESTQTTPPAQSLTPPPASGEQETVKQFELSVFVIDNTIIAQISGASDREVDIDLILGGKTIDMQALIGSGSVTFSGLSAGAYTLRAAYVTPADGVTAVEKTAEIKTADASVPSVDEKKPTVEKLGASVTVGKDYIEIKVTDADPWPMYVAVGNAYKTAALGEKVRFEGLSVGEYEIEIDYVTPVSGVSPFRTTVSVVKTQTYTPLQYGDTGDDVEEMTERLRDLGYMDDDVRRYSSAVREAVKTFQKINGLKADGVAGQETLALLYSDKAIAYGASGEYLTLMRGDKGLSSIYQLQRRLKDLGYYTIAVDGVYGSGTERAVRHFQRINGLDKTGIADNATQKLLYSSAAKPADSATAENYKTLSRSSKYHTAVVPLQRRLKALGYAVGSVDGYFGSQTYRAVREFQRRNGLKVTGVADEAMQRVLFSSSAISASGSASSSSSSSGSYYRLLYWGCKGEDVKTLQKALLSKGYTQVRVADGVYGEWTYDAVRAFQKDRGLSVDGIAGKDTQNALYGTKY